MTREGERDELEELEDGYELCPICSNAGSPTEVAVCAHYLGSWCEGSLIWSDFDYDSIWSQTSSSVWESDASVVGDFPPGALDPLMTKALEAIGYNDSGWWIEECDIQTIDHEPVGVLSDSVTSLYHQRPGEAFESISGALRRLGEQAELLIAREE